MIPKRKDIVWTPAIKRTCRKLTNHFGLKLLMFPVVLVVFLPSCGSAERPCESPQYLELGEAETINCSFSGNYRVISWFDSEDYHDYPLIELRGSEVVGRGYSSGEYDILPDGLLVIKNVSLEHEHTFCVVIIDDPHEDLIPHCVVVVTVVLPQQRHPRITNCSESSPGICYSQFDGRSVLECSVDGARPAVNLTWAVGVGAAERVVAHGAVVGHDLVFSTRARLADPFTDAVSVTLAVCKPSSPPGVLDDSAVYLFLQNTEHIRPTDPPVQYVEQGSDAVLTCPKPITEGLLVWNLETMSSAPVMIAFAAYGSLNFTSNPVSDEYALSDNGSLFISNVAVGPSGIYSCVTRDAEAEDAWVHNIQVYAPTFPEVDGCDPSRYCVLNAGDYEVLTCTIRGVPSDVRLEFRTGSPGFMFVESTTTVQQADSYYDVSLSTKYEIVYSSSQIVVIECGVIDAKSDLFSGTAVLSLHVEPGIIPTVGHNNNTLQKLTGAVVVLYILIIIIIIILAMLLLFRYREAMVREHRRSERGHLNESSTTTPPSTTVQTIPLPSNLQGETSSENAGYPTSSEDIVCRIGYHRNHEGTECVAKRPCCPCPLGKYQPSPSRRFCCFVCTNYTRVNRVELDACKITHDAVCVEELPLTTPSQYNEGSLTTAPPSTTDQTSSAFTTTMQPPAGKNRIQGNGQGTPAE